MNNTIYSPGCKIFGLPYTEWTVKWWEWLLSIPKQRSPAMDGTGLNTSANQIHPHVWFLAGTFGGFAKRICVIPHGRAIFMPIINYECSLVASPDVRTDSDLESKCKSEIDDIFDIKFTIDGSLVNDLSQYRVRSPPFKINAIKDNILNIAPGYTKMVTDGYWIFLKPLTIGRHFISTYGSCQTGKIMIKTSYDLIIK